MYIYIKCLRNGGWQRSFTTRSLLQALLLALLLPEERRLAAETRNLRRLSAKFGAWSPTKPQIAATSAHVSTRQHTSAHVSTRQHTPAYVSMHAHTCSPTKPQIAASPRLTCIRQHTSAYISIRQQTTRHHTSAIRQQYVSIRQQTPQMAASPLLTLLLKSLGLPLSASEGWLAQAVVMLELAPVLASSKASTGASSRRVPCC
jgi:hypothetical protein